MNGKSIYFPGYRHWALCIESASGEMEGVDFSPLRKSPGPAAGGGGRGDSPLGFSVTTLLGIVKDGQLQHSSSGPDAVVFTAGH